MKRAHSKSDIEATMDVYLKKKPIEERSDTIYLGLFEMEEKQPNIYSNLISICLNCAFDYTNEYRDNNLVVVKLVNFLCNINNVDSITFYSLEDSKSFLGEPGMIVDNKIIIFTRTVQTILENDKYFTGNIKIKIPAPSFILPSSQTPSCENVKRSVYCLCMADHITHHYLSELKTNKVPDFYNH